MLSSLGLIALLVSAVESAPISFTANVSSPISETLNFPLLDCVGSGHGSLALRADYRQHLANVQRDIGFKHIRGHGLLDDDMSTYLGGKANLINLFSVFDYYLSVGIKPIFELSFMPIALASNPSKTIMHYQGGTSDPKDYGQWATFMQQIATGLIERYGAEEVRSWHFEVWNEPQGCGFFCPANGNNLQSYLNLLYNTTATALLSVDAQLKVGGPATAGLAWVSEFINLTAPVSSGGGGIPASFLSTHSYPTDYRYNNSLTRTIWEENIIAVAAQSEAAGLPLIMTEVSAGLGNQYDAPFAAAFVVHAAAAFLGVSNMPTMSYWTFTDIFEEPGFVSTPWAETFGIQTKYGVPKPAYRALQLLSQFATTGIPVVASSGSIATAPKYALGPQSQATATVGTVDIITSIDTTVGAVNALVANFNANIKNAEDPSTGLPITTETVQITFASFPAGAIVSSTAIVQILNSTSGWAKVVWLAAGSPEYPNATEIASEMAASMPAVVTIPLTNTPGTTDFTVLLPSLEPYAVAFVTVNYEL